MINDDDNDNNNLLFVNSFLCAPPWINSLVAVPILLHSQRSLAPLRDDAAP